MSLPVRSCVACRRTQEKPALVRFALLSAERDSGEPQQEAVVVDPEQRRPGRGAYVCARRSCLDTALRREGRALLHALRRRSGQVTVDIEGIRAGWSAAAAEISREE